MIRARMASRTGSWCARSPVIMVAEHGENAERGVKTGQRSEDALRSIMLPRKPAAAIIIAKQNDEIAPERIGAANDGLDAFDWHQGCAGVEIRQRDDPEGPAIRPAGGLQGVAGDDEPIGLAKHRIGCGRNGKRRSAGNPCENGAPRDQATAFSLRRMAGSSPVGLLRLSDARRKTVRAEAIAPMPMSLYWRTRCCSSRRATAWAAVSRVWGSDWAAGVMRDSSVKVEMSDRYDLMRKSLTVSSKKAGRNCDVFVMSAQSRLSVKRALTVRRRH